jgi:iron complex transport system substrate-binding protein
MMTRSRRIWVSLFIAVSFTLLVVMVQGNNRSLNVESSKTEQNCRRVEHSIGIACVPLHPKRVITLSTMDLGNALALGSQPIATASDFNEGKSHFPPYLYPQAQGIPTVGSSAQPSLEKILSLKPDLIFGWWGSNPEAINPLLTRIAPTVVYNWEEYSWKDIFNLTAQLLGKEQEAQAVWQHYQTRIQDLKTALGNRYQDKKISFVYFYFGQIGTVVNNSFAGSILKDAGLQRPPAQDRDIEPDGYTEFSLEEIDWVDGDVLFVASFTDDDRKMLKQLQQNPLWRTLNAVQQQQVYFVSGVTWLWGPDMIGAEAVIDDLFKYLVNTP